MSDEWWLLVRMLKFIMCADELIPWYTGHTFYGLNLKRQEKGWFLVISAKRINGERVVAYYAGHKPWDCFAALAGDVAHHSVQWAKDKYVR